MIHVHIIPHASQDYETVGDWRTDGRGDWVVRVSEMGDWRYHFLVALHEQIEMALCKARGVLEGEVTAFDKGFEAARATTDDREPGDNVAAPYCLEHTFASRIERKMADEMGVDWADYEAKVMGLSK